MVSNRCVTAASVTQTRATYSAALIRWASDSRGHAFVRGCPLTRFMRRKVLSLGRSRSIQVWVASGMGTSGSFSATTRRLLASNSRPSIQAWALQKVFLPRHQIAADVPPTWTLSASKSPSSASSGDRLRRYRMVLSSSYQWVIASAGTDGAASGLLADHGRAEHPAVGVGAGAGHRVTDLRVHFAEQECQSVAHGIASRRRHGPENHGCGC